MRSVGRGLNARKNTIKSTIEIARWHVEHGRFLLWARTWRPWLREVLGAVALVLLVCWGMAAGVTRSPALPIQWRAPKARQAASNRVA